MNLNEYPPIEIDREFNLINQNISASSKKILVVDDEEEIVEILSYNLKQNKYKVITAYDGGQALELAQTETPDLIILDFMLPVLSGPEVAQNLKNLAETEDIPIIFLTARCDSESVVEGLKTGAADYVTKPFNIVELLARIETQLKLKSALDRLKRTENELRKANIVKDKFFTVFIHDIRAPIHTLGGYIQMLHDRYDRMEEPKRKRVISNIQKNSGQVHKLLENLLQWSRLQTGLFEWNPQKFSLRSIITKIESLFYDQLKSKQIKLEIEIDASIQVFADEGMVESIVRNLLQNAIKFTPAEGQIRIYSGTVGDYQEVTIADSGIGINEENIAKIFSLEHCTTTEGLDGEKGTGLGLVLCREFIEINGGRIDVNSTPGKGTDFMFTLPQPYA